MEQPDKQACTQGKRKRCLKGSDIYLLVMFAGWIAYVLFSAWFYIEASVWLPLELTIGTVLLFLYETFALYKLALAREEGKPLGKALERTKQATDAVKGWVSRNMGLGDPADLDEEIAEYVHIDKKEASDD